MSSETKDLNNYEYTSSYNQYNIINQNMINLPYVSGPPTYNANLSPHEGAYDLGFELSPSSSEFFHPSFDQDNGLSSAKSHEVVGANIESEIRVSASASSSENCGKIPRKREADDGGEDDQPSQKIVKTKKKEEKKQKEPRVSFMTKTDVDHLEDGYRWRKYGQKAVKNSPYPRSYYRCTTQKCNVKKRVERSYQDPTVVITTYESQHNHLVPTNRRTGMFSGPAVSDYNPSSSAPLFSDFIFNTPRSFSNDDLFREPYASMNVNPNYQQQYQEFHQRDQSEFELLKEIFPVGFFKQES